MISKIRNFVIIAHIDHGKSTLADRFLELTHTVEKRKMQAQYLDQMDLERERGITIKLQPVRMKYNDHVLNLIDTPGHVDFSYEVSRSLAAVEGAILLVDASKGIQAQTLANLQLAKAQGLKIIPAINKIDLPNARTKEVKEELSNLLEVGAESILEISAKEGINIDKLLDKVIDNVPGPEESKDNILKALIFDSTFDTFKGVIAYVRIFSGQAERGQKFNTLATKISDAILEVGHFSPALVTCDELTEGNIGYIATGLKNPDQIRVGDTISSSDVIEPLKGYREPRPMVFASFFPEKSDEYDELRDALDKLKLTDASLIYEPDSSVGLGRGFKIGFLGMLHLEIISERLRREFKLPLIVSSPSVEYIVSLNNGEQIKIKSAFALPDPSRIKNIAEPVVELEIIAPSSYVGNVMKLVANYRNTYISTDYLGKNTVHLKYEVPLAEILTDFYDKLKSVSSGYASMSYESLEPKKADLIKMDILVAGDIVEPFSRIIPRESAYKEGKVMVEKLKEVIPPQLFQVAIQAAIGGKIIARETIKARRKDVTGYLYGGDVTRKKKLLEKQKKGKKKMKETGKVNIPHDVYLKVLRR